MYKISSDIVLCAEFATKYMRRYFCAYYWSKLGLGQGEAFRLDEETFKKNGGQVHRERLRLHQIERAGDSPDEDEFNDDQDERNQ